MKIICASVTFILSYHRYMHAIFILVAMLMMTLFHQSIIFLITLNIIFQSQLCVNLHINYILSKHIPSNWKMLHILCTYSINISQSEVIDIQFFGYVQCSMNYNGCFIRVSGPVKNISQAYQCYILMHPERYFQQYNINCPHLMLILKTSSCIYNSCCI